MSVKNRADQKIHKLKESYDHLVERATKLQKHNDDLVISLNFLKSNVVNVFRAYG